MILKLGLNNDTHVIHKKLDNINMIIHGTSKSKINMTNLVL